MKNSTRFYGSFCFWKVLLWAFAMRKKAAHCQDNIAYERVLSLGIGILKKFLQTSANLTF